MATLVLSSVGTALGGPVGSAIGALIGQSVDQQLLSPVRRGPRVGDLAVQTSSYGTQIPRIYGSMRVAGTVVWATDLVESTETSGAKGQPDVTYSYSVSLAVALSSRRARSIGRIWADGKLLRGSGGDFKVETGFRFYDGGDDQIIDPLIGSIEGIGSTPAYRGVALAVFENLQLANFGNRIPMMTFEVIAEQEAPSVGQVLTDASAAAIVSAVDEKVMGFAAYGRSIRSAVEPLVECFGLELFDDGTELRSPAHEAALPIALEDLGNSAESKQLPRLVRDQSPAAELPATLRLTYYDAARDYQTGEAQVSAAEQPRIERQHDLPAVMDAAAAKSVAHGMIARAWAERDRLTLRLPPNMIGLEPGRTLRLALSACDWRLEKATIEGFVVVAELRPLSSRAGAVEGDGGRIVPNVDTNVGPLSLALLEVPSGAALASDDPVGLLAATTAIGWRRQPVTVSFGGQSSTIEVPRGKGVVGRVQGALGAGSSDLADDRNSVLVTLVDHDQWLTSCDDDALAAGENLAMVGNELIQFAEATPLGEGQFRLSHLLRGRGGSEWACGGHLADELFCLLKSGTVEVLPLPLWAVGATLAAVAPRGAATSMEFQGESIRPPAPVNLAADIEANGDLVLSWTRRSRRGFAWVDGADAPLGETSEQYHVSLASGFGFVERVVTQPTLTLAASDILGLGNGPISIEVRQAGDLAMSRPAQLSTTFA